MTEPTREELDAFWESDVCRSVFPPNYNDLDTAEGWYPELEGEDESGDT